MDPLAREAVDLLHETYGRHEGHRAVHAKGTVCRGVFTPTPEASRLTRAAHHAGRAGPGYHALLERQRQPVDPRLRPRRSRDGHQVLPARWLADGHRGPQPAVLLRADPRGLRRVHSRWKAAAGDQPAGPSLRALSRHSPRGAAGGPCVPGAQATGELCAAPLQRAPRVPLGRRERRGALRPLQLAARSRRSHDLRRARPRPPARTIFAGNSSSVSPGSPSASPCRFSSLARGIRLPTPRRGGLPTVRPSPWARSS